MNENTTTLETRLYNGDRAREVLENEVFQAVFDDIEKELFQAWKQSPQRDADARERIHLSVSLLAKIKACLMSTLDTGKLAKLELEHKRSMSERLKDAKRAIFSE